MSSIEKMNHVVAIQKYIEAIIGSEDMHSLIVEGPPGWGKSTCIEEALKNAHVQPNSLGAFSTPLNFYNFLAENPLGVILLDDCSGIFSDTTVMAILKAATWPNRDNKRIIQWGSTTNKSITDEFEFKGKIIVVCNSFPKTPDGNAIRSRGYSRKIEMSVLEAKKLLLDAAKDNKWYSNAELAISVAEFLNSHLSDSNLSEISFRTLKKGYRLAEVHPHAWQELFSDFLPKASKDPNLLVIELASENIKVKEQAQRFAEQTGLGIRSFYNYRKEAKLSNRRS